MPGIHRGKGDFTYVRGSEKWVEEKEPKQGASESWPLAKVREAEINGRKSVVLFMLRSERQKRVASKSPWNQKTTLAKTTFLAGSPVPGFVYCQPVQAARVQSQGYVVLFPRSGQFLQDLEMHPLKL